MISSILAEHIFIDHNKITIFLYFAKNIGKLSRKKIKISLTKRCYCPADKKKTKITALDKSISLKMLATCRN